MNKRDARQIAEKITNKELFQMLKNAREEITNWEQVSVCNKSFDKGIAWNILAKDFDLNYQYHILTKTNIIREFGNYFFDYSKPRKQKPKIELHHQKPDFTNW